MSPLCIPYCWSYYRLVNLSLDLDFHSSVTQHSRHFLPVLPPALRQVLHPPPVSSPDTWMSSISSPPRPLAVAPGPSVRCYCNNRSSSYRSLVFAILLPFSILLASFPPLLFWCYTARCRPRTACTRVAVPWCLDPVHPWPSQRDMD